MEKHQQYLDDLCRVCGKKVGRVRYSVMKYQEVLSSMGLFVAHDIEHIHLKQFCNSCYLTGKRMTDKGTNYSYSRVIPPIWEEHIDDKCNLCNQMVQKGKGGRQKKNHTCRGRPTSLVSYVASLSVPGVQSHSLLPSSTSSNINITHLICIRCKNIVNFPVEITPCRALICKECCIQCIREYKPTFKCHKCKEEHPNEELTFVVPSPVILNVWESLNYPCQQSCGKLFNTNELDAHYRIQCSESHNTIVSSTSPSSKPTQSEQQVAASVVQRMLSDSNIISLSVPKGKVITTHYVI